MFAGIIERKASIKMLQWKTISLLPSVLLLAIPLCSCWPFSEPAVVRTPESRFKDLHTHGYPWDPKYFWMSVTGVNQPLRVHYVDEGKN